MIIIFGSIILIILVIFVILAINKQIDYKIPILFMFFVLVSAPFIHLDKNIVQLEKFTNSSLDIYYTNQKKTKASECDECAGICDDKEHVDNKNELYIPLLDPLKLKINKKKFKSIMIDYIVIKKEYFDCSINKQTFDNEDPLNLIQVDVEGKIKHHVLKNESEINKLFKSTKDNTYIILITFGKLTIKNPDYNLDIDFKSDESTSITIVFKSQDEYNPILKKDNKFGLSNLNGYKLFDNREFKMIDFQGKIYNNTVKLESEKKYVYKNSLISSHNTKTKQYLVFSNENNQSFVYLSGSTNQFELYDYKKTDGNEIRDITLLDTNNPQKWDIEFVQSNYGGQNSYIKTSSYPTFYLEVVDNEIKMNMYRGGSNQFWKLIKTSGKNLFTIQHSKTGMFLSYQMNDGYLYKNNGSVYLTENGMEWNIESNTIIDKSLTISDNDWIEITSPNDFVNEEKPIFDLRGRINGKMINLSSKGRTTWDQKYSPIWNGSYIYYGTVINNNNYLTIKLDKNGNGTVKDPLLGISIKVSNVGANILYGHVNNINIQPKNELSQLGKIYNMLSPFMSDFKNPSFYEYNLDGNEYYIGDGGNDMFDGGNYTRLRIDGNVSSDLSYSQTTQNNVSVNGKTAQVISLGYQRPLIMLAYSSQRANIGMSKKGNIGADGGGNTTSYNVYNGAKINGYTVYSWVRIIYNASDPSIGDLYFVIGDESTKFFGNMNTYASTNTDDGESYMTMDCQGALVGTILLSKPSGAYISISDCITVMNNFVKRLDKNDASNINLEKMSVVLEMVPEKYDYRGVRESYPVKIRYLLIGENKIYSLGSSSLDNLDSYATKKEGDIIIYSNLMESKGIQVDEKLARPKLK